MPDMVAEATKNQRSVFVTVLAWISVILSAASGLYFAVMIAAAFLYLRSTDQQGLTQRWLLALAILAMTVVASVCSVGLLRRRKWARLAFLTVMCFAALYQVISIGWSLTRDYPHSVQAAVSKDPNLGALFFLALAFKVIAQFVLCILFIWIARKLTTPAIMAEFSVQQGAHDCPSRPLTTEHANTTELHLDEIIQALGAADLADQAWARAEYYMLSSDHRERIEAILSSRGMQIPAQEEP